MKPQPRGLALLRCMSPVAAEADIRAVGGSSGFDPKLLLIDKFCCDARFTALYGVVLPVTREHGGDQLFLP
jgi:hypothetical protein